MKIVREKGKTRDQAKKKMTGKKKAIIALGAVLSAIIILLATTYGVFLHYYNKMNITSDDDDEIVTAIDYEEDDINESELTDEERAQLDELMNDPVSSAEGTESEDETVMKADSKNVINVPLFTGKGTFVCEGYAKAFKILCDRFGIGCALVSGNGMTSASSGGPHMWNYVRMPDGKWYGVDATWDDGYFLQDGTPFPYYTYFLIGSSTEVRNNRTFAQDHIPDGQIMTQPMKFSMVYPELSEVAYDHYIVDTDPKITLTTLGASIRISDPYGIRFGIQLKRDEALSSIHYIPEFGTLIIASGTLGNNELTINTPKVRKIKANNIFSQDETQYTYTGVLINIPESFFGTNVKGRGYLIYVDDETGEEHIVYSETVERSFYGVAQAAYDSYSGIADPDEDQQAIIEKLRGFLENR